MSQNKENNNLNLRSEEVQEILTNPPTWIIRWGITLIFLITCKVTFLAFLVRYPEFVSAEVIVTTKQPTERLVARYSGPLANIYIENGDTVGKGQRLAAFRNTARIQDVYKLKEILDTIQIDSYGLDFPINVTSNLILGDIETAYIEFEKNYINYSLSRELQPFTGQLLNNQISFEELKTRLSDQLQQKELYEREFQLKKSEFERYEKLFHKGVIARQEYENKEMEYLQIQRSINTMAISVSQLRESISSAYQTLERTRFSKREEETHLLANLSQSYNILKKVINDWEHEYILSSSTKGTVSFHGVWGVNQFVNSGDIIFSIFPDENSILLGKLIISARNSGKVSLEQKVLVKLDNFPYQQYGKLVGKVESISVSPDLNGNYFVYVSFPNNTTTSYENSLPFDQELVGTAEIITDELSLADRIFYKFREIGIF